MKKILLPFFLISILLISSTVFSQNTINLEIVHALGNQPFAFSEASQSPDGGDFNLSRLEYYMSEFTITHDGGQTTSVSNVWALVNAGETTVVDLGSLDVTDIEGVSFYIGVDPEHNHLDPSTYSTGHPLANQNPSMHWGWTAGYRFIAMEGMGGPMLDQLFEIHALGDEYYYSVSLDVAASADAGVVAPVIYADYSASLENIDVSKGVITHGSFGEAIVLLENFRDVVFSVTNPIDTTTGTPSGISENKNSSDFQIFPNPTTNGNVLIKTASNSDLMIEVIDLTGKSVLVETLNSSNPTLNIQSLQTGVYFIRANDLETGDVVVKKLSVQ